MRRKKAGPTKQPYKTAIQNRPYKIGCTKQKDNVDRPPPVNIAFCVNAPSANRIPPAAGWGNGEIPLKRVGKSPIDPMQDRYAHTRRSRCKRDSFASPDPSRCKRDLRGGAAIAATLLNRHAAAQVRMRLRRVDLSLLFSFGLLIFGTCGGCSYNWPLHWCSGRAGVRSFSDHSQRIFAAWRAGRAG